MRVNESMLRTRDVNDSRFGFGIGELLVIIGRDGDFVDDTGMDELLRLQLLNDDESLRRLCADSGRCKLGDCIAFVTEFGPERPKRLPVLLLRLRFDGGPDGLLRCVIDDDVVDDEVIRPVGGFGAR